jgi:hypothetical protein
MKKVLGLAMAAVFIAAPLTADQPALAVSQVVIHDVKAGQFCKKADIGKKKIADNGVRVKCVKDGSRARWTRI